MQRPTLSTRIDLSVMLVCLTLSALCLLPGSRPAEAQRYQTSHPPAATLVKVSAARMLALHSVHSTGHVGLWSSGTNGNHIPVTTDLALTGDCSISVHGATFTMRTRFHARGSQRAGGRRTRTIDAQYITVASGKKAASGPGSGSLRLWERSARTHGVWRQMPLQTVVQEPAYELGNNGQCPNDRAVQLISPSRFRLIGTVLINGHRSWHLHGQQTTGDTTDVHLYIDRASLLWNRIATTFVIRNNGRVVNRLPSRIDYSRFNRPVAISP